MKRANLKSQKFCAFCKNWYDPTNSYIEPVEPEFSIWNFDQFQKNHCMKRRHEVRADERCQYYDCKIK